MTLQPKTAQPTLAPKEKPESHTELGDIGRDPHAEVEKDITNLKKQLYAAGFIAPTETSEALGVDEEGFSGSFISGEPLTPFDQAGEFNLGMVQAGVTKYGIGPGGEYANGLDFLGLHKATASSGNERQLRRGFQELQGSNEASYLFEYIETLGGSNLITSNPGFETGDATGWTLGGSSSIEVDSHFGSGYVLGLGLTSGDNATSNKYACTAGAVLSVSLKGYTHSNPRVKAYIRFYNATPTLLATTTIFSDTVDYVIKEYAINASVPVGATQFEIYIVRTGTDSEQDFFDDFSVTTLAISNKLGFHGENGAVITEAEDNELANVAFGNAQIAPWPIAVTGTWSGAGGQLDNGSALYKYQITFMDNVGGESLPNPISAAIVSGGGGGSTSTIILSKIPKRPPGCVTINIYRTEGGGAILYYAGALATDAATYVDTAADSALDLTRTVPTYNSTIERPFYPPFALLPATMMMSNATLTLAIIASEALSLTNGTIAANANDGDWFAFPIFIAKGTYTLETRGRQQLTSGKIDVYLDGAITGITAQDWYSNPAVNNVAKTGSITIPTSGYHQMLLKVNGKHASSTDYTMAISYIQLTPAAY